MQKKIERPLSLRIAPVVGERGDEKVHGVGEDRVEMARTAGAASGILAFWDSGMRAMALLLLATASLGPLYESRKRDS